MERMNLLISDLDGTLLGDDKALDEFATWYANAREHYRLAYSSGRFVDSVLNSIESSVLPEPDAIIGGVGTQIYDVERARVFPMWPPQIIEWNPYIVQTIGEGFSELKLQPPDSISHNKVSFYGRNLDASVFERLQRQMDIGGQRVSMIYSSDRDLDILPEASCKAAAALYLARHWQISTDRTVVAGNSGNDLDMLLAGFRGIVVGNAAPELRSLNSPTIYLAQQCYAAGVVEGIRHWQSKDGGSKDYQVRKWN